MLLTSKEVFLKLAVPKKQAKSLKTTLCGIVNEKCHTINVMSVTSTCYNLFFGAK